MIKFICNRLFIKIDWLWMYLNEFSLNLVFIFKKEFLVFFIWFWIFDRFVLHFHSKSNPKEKLYIYIYFVVNHVSFFILLRCVFFPYRGFIHLILCIFQCFLLLRLLLATLKKKKINNNSKINYLFELKLLKPVKLW